MSSKATSTLRLVVVAALLLLLPSAALAQAISRISGTVLDENGEPVEDAKVTVTTEAIPDFKADAETNRRGRFLIAVPDGTKEYEFVFEKDEYMRVIQKVKPTPGQNRFMEFELPTRASQMAKTPPPSVPGPGEMGGAEGAEGEAAAAPVRDPALKAYNDAVNAWREDDLATAETKLMEAIEEKPDLTMAHSMLSVVLMDQDKYEAAAAAAERALELDPADFKALNMRYRAYQQLGNEEMAEEAREDLKAAGEAGDAAARIFNEAVDALSQQRYTEAQALFNEALALDENLVQARAALADILFRTGSYRAAAQAAERVIAADPANLNMYKLRYDAARIAGDIPMMKSACTDLLARDAEASAPVLLTQAVEHFDADETVRARGILESLAALPSPPPRTHYHLGLVLLNQGETDAAREHLKKFIELAPDDPEAAVARALVQAGG